MKEKLTCIIVDDEQRARTLLQNMLERYCENVSVLANASNINDASEIIKKYNPDLIFLDIEMPGGNGFELVEKFEDPHFNIVFVTAYQKYAIKAIRLAALDYLLKPVDPEEPLKVPEEDPDIIPDEDPFENRITDIPMTAMCTTIERDLKEMLGEKDLPDKKLPVNGFLN